LQKADLLACGLDFSPITGQNGNIEYLLHITKNDEKISELNIQNVVKTAFMEL